MKHKVSMEMIAQELGLSKNTVSLAMRGMPGIGEETRARILDTADRMGYRYRKANEDVKTAPKNICVVVPTIANDREGFFAHIQIGIEQEARKHHVNTLFHSYEEDGEHFDLPLCIREGQVMGIISVGRVSETTARIINRCNLPYIMADTYLEQIDEDCVHTDNMLGGDRATEYLISMGHRDIGFIGDTVATVSFRDRYRGYLNAMGRHGLTVNERHCIIHTGIDDLIREGQGIAQAEMEKLDGLPTAFFCANDAGAISVYRTLRAMGLRIPEDVSVMGFDDTEVSALVSPELTTMRVHKELMGRKAFLRLIEKLKDRTGPSVRERLLISAEIVERQSVRKIQF